MTTDTRFSTLPRPPRYRKRTLSRFEIWAWSPIIVLRIALVSTYLVYVYAGIIAFIAGIPVFDLLDVVPGYTSVWATIITLSAIPAAIGSLSERWSTLEKWSTMILSSMMLAYTGSLNLVGFVSGDQARQFAGAMSVIALLLPATRFVYLAAQSGKKKKPHDHGDA